MVLGASRILWIKSSPPVPQGDGRLIVDRRVVAKMCGPSRQAAITDYGRLSGEPRLQSLPAFVELDVTS
jgi:hypothetical protein